MRDLTLSGEFPIASLSSLHLPNIDDVYTQFSRIIRSHDVVTYELDRSRSELHYAPLSRMALSSARLGSDMLVDAQAVPDTCLIFCAIDEPFYMIIDGQCVQVTADKSGVVMPGTSFKLQVVKNVSSLMLDIDVRYLESLIAQEMNNDLNAPLSFLRDDAEPGNESGFSKLVHLIYEQVKEGSPEINNSKYLKRLEELIATTLIYTKRHNYSNALKNVVTPVAPRFVTRAVEYIHSHAQAPLTLSSLAEIAATSQRSLIRGFQKYHNCTPMGYLRRVRLERARDDLLRACPEDYSVMTIAEKWGFSNQGRFTSEYRKCYGEYPTETLRRRVMTN